MKKRGSVYVISSMMAITLIGKVLGLIREILIGAAFGSSGDGAAFNLASAIPRNFLDIAFASAISGCFIPVFNTAMEKKGTEEAYKLANLFITAILIVSCAITVLAVVFSDGLAVVMGPGNSYETQILTGKLFKITLPIIILSALAFSLTGILQSMGEFNIPAAMSIISNGCIILYCIFFTDNFGVYGLAVVFLIGWALQILIQFPGLKKAKYAFKFSLDFKNPAWREIKVLILPVMISTWVMPVNDIVNISISTRISEAASVAYSKANVLYSVITGVFVLSVANYMFPELTRINARADDETFGKTLETVIRALFFFLIPMAAGLFLLAAPLSRMIFLAGKFDQNAVLLTADALKFFCVGIMGFGLQTILSRAFYAQKNAIIPLLTGIAAVIANAVLSYLLKDRFGVGGPALASSLSFALTAAVMLVFMYRRNKYILNIKMLTDILLVCLCAAVMGVAVMALYLFIDSKLPSGTLFDFFRIAPSVIAGVAVYFGLTLIFRVKEAKTAMAAIKGLFARGRA